MTLCLSFWIWLNLIINYTTGILKNKARILGKDKIEFHDTLAPVSSENLNDEISFEDGYKMYLGYIEKFDSEFFEYSKEIFEDGRVSVFPDKFKRGGAYASYGKGDKSFCYA